MEKELTRSSVQSLSNRGCKIKELRSFLGLSMASFGEVINYSSSHISKFEKGITEPSDAVLEAICEGFHVEPEYFTDPEMDADEAVGRHAAEQKVEGAGKRIKAAREAKRWTQTELAEAISVVQPVISRLESSDTTSAKMGRRIAGVLECGYDWLMYGEEEKRNYPVELLTDWLWKHPEIREELWMRMKGEV